MPFLRALFIAVAIAIIGGGLIGFFWASMLDGWAMWLAIGITVIPLSLWNGTYWASRVRP